MFGNSANQMVHMVQKHQWDKVEKKLQKADPQAKAALATACGGSSDEAAATLLVNLLQDDDENVVLQAVTSLGAVGSANAKTHLQWLSNHTSSDRKELLEAIGDAVAKISTKK